MALRLIEIVAPEEYLESIQGFLRDYAVTGSWTQSLRDETCLVRVLLPTEETEAVIDVLEKRFSNVEGFRLMLFTVEATVPRHEPVEPAPAGGGGGPERKGGEKPPLRISREELYEDICVGARLTKPYVAMVCLSSVVAAVGLIRDNPAVTIGAMVIAPLLGPNMALALSTTLGDFSLTRAALRAGAIGTLIAFLLAVLIGLVFPVPLEGREVLSRTEVGWGDIALALAAGGAGAIAFTAGYATTLVGVMVAVALLPPLVATGLLLGKGCGVPALGALLMFSINFICINLAAVTTFWVQGIRPKRWWEAQKAKRATRTALVLWTVLLLLLALILALHLWLP
ncbi:MAG: TIGR00341 family protein [Planctomycetota bacterium]|jgi:uncharacterized hydrophobic protein (TIGR00341 family)